MGGFIILFGLISLFVKERLYLSEAFVATLVGVAFGPVAANLLHTSDLNDETLSYLTEEFARIVIAIQVMTAGVELPSRYLWNQGKSLMVLLVPVMIWMWLVSASFVYVLIPGLNFLEALMIASCVTPTDPILANSIVKGKFAEEHVPPHVRNIISAESGANDGLGFPFLYLAIYLIQIHPTGAAIGKWAYGIMVFQILLSIVIGIVVGYIARKILQWAERNNLIDKQSFLVFAIALALFIVGVVTMIGSDDLLACFIAGNSFTWDDWFRQETEEAHLSEAIDMLLNLTIFVYIGAIMPWKAFSDVGIWRLIVLAIAILILRRLPAVVALYKFIPAVKTFREATFTGWFGPIGVGAVFYAMVARDAFDANGPNAYARLMVEPIVFFLILASVVVHGVTIPLFNLGTFASRTLTQGSTSNVVVRLPKLQFGQEIVFRRSTDERDLADMERGNKFGFRSSASLPVGLGNGEASNTSSDLRTLPREHATKESSDDTNPPVMYQRHSGPFFERSADKSIPSTPSDSENPLESERFGDNEQNESSFVEYNEGEDLVRETKRGSEISVIPLPGHHHIHHHEEDNRKLKSPEYQGRSLPSINFGKLPTKRNLEDAHRKEIMNSASSDGAQSNSLWKLLHGRR
ncbi:hypothetical protein BZG36_02041 [Bifiguratus adelaidae]|uniref:Cation/H+ exchanger transmembrane domain-containing protein n=1 Tax=Bifiguratus adelaidae TaxID=1938954 RepID=A0A261Y201_9FUNG|nr:hypothetical protein BZG36_02041 [Bifiguratus adelaidae]